MIMKLKLNIVLSNAQSNILITLQHTGVHYPTSSIINKVEIEIPDPPNGFAIDSITIDESDLKPSVAGE